MAASGALETVASIMMLQDNCLIPTLNLHEPDPACGEINLLTELMNLNPVRQPVIIKNSFALGGLNSSLVIRGYDE
jgi:3-oxoacyl-[acyl-carrier-protein] synthase II